MRVVEVLSPEMSKLMIFMSALDVKTNFRMVSEELTGVCEYPQPGMEYPIKKKLLMLPQGFQFLFIVPVYSRHEYQSIKKERLFITRGPALYKPPLSNIAEDGTFCVGDSTHWDIRSTQEYIDNVLTLVGDNAFNNEWPDPRFKRLKFIGEACVPTEETIMSTPIFDEELSATIIGLDQNTETL